MAASGLLGTTRRGRPVYHVGHASYAGLENHRVFGAEPHVLGGLARQAHPHYTAADHAEAADFHYAKRNLQAGRAHDAAAQQMSKGQPMTPTAPMTLQLGSTTSGLPIPPPWDSPLSYVYDGVGQELDVGQAAAALGAAGPSMAAQDHLDTAVAYHALAAALSQSGDARAEASAKAAFMHFAAAGVDPMAVNFAPTVMGQAKKSLSNAEKGKSMPVNVLNSLSKSTRAPGTTYTGKKIPEASHDVAHLNGLSDQRFHGQSIAKKYKGWTSKDHAGVADHFALKMNGAKGNEKHDFHIASAAHNAAAKVKQGLGKSASNTQEKTMSKSIVGYLASGEPVYSSMPAEMAAKSDATSVLQDYLSKAEKGEGSRGGKVIGHTKSGKPVYAAKDHDGYKKIHAVIENQASDRHIGKVAEDAHPSYTKQDHVDASKLHLKMAMAEGNPRIGHVTHAGNAASAHHLASYSVKKSLSKLDKAEKGEGSRGGHIIGHSKNGRPIYGSSHAVHKQTLNQVKSEETIDGTKLAGKLYQLHTKYTHNDHADAASAHLKEAERHKKIAEQHYNGMTKEMSPAQRKSAAKKGDAHFAMADFHKVTAAGHKTAAGYHAESGKPVQVAEKSLNASWAPPSSYMGKYRGEMSKAEKGEGSRGGKVIGHTKSGKPIYGANKGYRSIQTSAERGEIHDYHATGLLVHQANPGYSRADHMDAAAEHHKAAEAAADSLRSSKKNGVFGTTIKERNLPAHRASLKSEANYHRAVASGHKNAAVRADKAEKSLNASWAPPSSYMGKYRGEMSKAEKGEGSRGGKVIGHTQSGKPVYAASAAHSPKYADFSHTDHADAASLHSAAHSSGVRLMISKKTSPEDAKKQNKKNRQVGALAVAHSRAAAYSSKANKSLSAQSFTWAPSSSYMGKYRAD